MIYKSIESHPLKYIFIFYDWRNMMNVMDIITELARRGCNGPTDSEAAHTLRWFDYFVEFFLEGSNNDGEEEEEDDLLFFIQQDGGLFIKRRVGSEVPRLEGLVRWEETFYVNLIARLTCEVRVTVCGGEGRVIREGRGRVFAEPTRVAVKDPMGGFEPTFPNIYFSFNDSEWIFADIEMASEQELCVELRVLLNGPGWLRRTTTTTTESEMLSMDGKSDELSDGLYVAWEDSAECVMLFQGVVKYGALLGVHRKKAKMRPSTPQRVLMRGPHGCGYAEVMVTDVVAQGLNPMELFFRTLRTHPSTSSPPLRCCLTYIHLHWRLIILHLYHHHNLSR